MTTCPKAEPQPTHRWERLWWWTGRVQICRRCDRLRAKIRIRQFYSGLTTDEWVEFDAHAAGSRRPGGWLVTTFGPPPRKENGPR